MKVVKSKLVFVCAIVLLMSASVTVFGDWKEGDPYKMHHPQLPNPEGWDICVVDQWVADDFKCGESGKITDIHFWISWQGDRYLEDILQLSPDISIWSDRGGQPGVMLWQWNTEGQVNVAGPWFGQQGWACPAMGLMNPLDHQMYFQINITEIPEPVLNQEKDTVYWLVVRVGVPDPYKLGWKTSTNDREPVLKPIFGSPAMWSRDQHGWQPVGTGMTAPRVHDLAFVITGVPDEPPVLIDPTFTFQVADWVNPEPHHAWIPTEMVSLSLHANDPCEQIQEVEFSWLGPDGTWVPIARDPDGSEPKVTTLPDDEPPEDGDGWAAEFDPSVVPQMEPGGTLVKLRAQAFAVDSFFDVFTELTVDPNPPDAVEMVVEVQGDMLNVGVIPEFPHDIDRIIVDVELKPEEFAKGIPPLDQLKEGRAYGGGYHCAPTATAACLKYFEGEGDDEIGGGLSGDGLTDALAGYQGCNEGGYGTYFGEWVDGIRKWIADHGDGYTVRSYKYFDWRTARNELERCQDVLLRLEWPNGFGHALTLNSIHNTPQADGTIRIDLMDPYKGTISYGDLDPTTGQLTGFEGASGNSGRFTHMIIICPKEEDPGGGGIVHPGPGPIHVGPYDPGRYFVRVTVVDKAEHAATLISIVELKEADFGDAPEGDAGALHRALAYPSSCQQGFFPTCIQVGPLGSFVRHTIGGAYFGPLVDGEPDGNAGKCPLFNPDTYNQDECFKDGDAGLRYPAGYTIVGPIGAEAVVPCNANDTGSLGVVCTLATWGKDIEIDVTNNSTMERYVNVVFDWNKNGRWGGVAVCPPCLGGMSTAEHILQNVRIPAGYSGPLTPNIPAALKQFLIGPNPGFVWVRFTISDGRVSGDWDGSGIFGDGESEDYLLQLKPAPVTNPCDWNEGDEHKMHHAQLPDLDYTGVDIDMTYTPLADDFKCAETGWITDMHFWGSFADDCLPAGGAGSLTFRVSIWSDIPAGADRHSMPGQMLWTRQFTQCDYTVRRMEDGPEDWYDPVTGLYLRQNHHQAYQYNICLTEDEGFEQEKGTIYWLEIKDIVDAGFEPDYTFGWKTTQLKPNDLRFNDDGVYRDSTGAGWAELRYPDTHEFQGESMDLAFVITGEGAPPPPLDWGDAPDPTYPTLSASIGASHVIDPRIYMGLTVDSDPDGQPTAAADGDDTDPDGDDEDGVTFDTPLVPGQPAQITVNASFPGVSAGAFISIWIDYGGDGGWGEAQDYEVQSVPAVVGNNPFNFVVPAAAVVGPTYVRVRLTTAPNIPFDGPAPDGEVEDYIRDIEPPYEPKPPVPHLKWSQPPIEIKPVVGAAPRYCGWDEISMSMKQAAGIDASWTVAADDFRCLGRMPITSVHWWGSYKDWLDVEPPHQAKPVYWHIGFWSNAKVGVGAMNFSRPVELLHMVRVKPENVEEVWVGTDEFPHRPSESCFQYFVHFEDPDNEYFWQAKFLNRTEDNTFWISIVPVYEGYPGPQIPWGWKTRPEPWMDDAVTFHLVQDVLDVDQVLDPAVIQIEPIRDESICGLVEGYDLAFELDTDPHFIKWEQPFTGLRHWKHYEDEKSFGHEETITEMVVKYGQMPDLTDDGMDVDASTEGRWPAQVLADDFPCDVTGPLTNITIYGSWYHDELPGAVAPDPHAVIFTLSIHEDIPASQSPTGYSMPGRQLWIEQFDAGHFGATIFAQDLQEGWFVPCVHPPFYEFPADTVCWRYDFSIGEATAFRQRGTADEPKIYWLDVQARPIGTEARFGWKTSPDHWMDDAVWIQGHEPVPNDIDWNELVYPPQHPKAKESIDLAFEIATEVTRTEVAIDRLVADDWRCTTKRPVTAAVWWGSYIGYNYEACECDTWARPNKPSYFLLSIWTDVPEDSTLPGSYSHPGEKVWEYKAYASACDEVLVGYAKHPEYGPGQTPGREAVFRYSVRLPGRAWFYQKEDNAIYWFSVVAVYDEDNPMTRPWGWTNHAWEFQDNAVAGSLDLINGAWVWEELYDQAGNDQDMSFMLFTDPDCFPSWFTTYADWVRYGKPDCWCAPPEGNGLQCDGDADGKWENPLRHYRVYIQDLNMLIANWKLRDNVVGLPGGPDPCADIDHKWENPLRKYRVYIQDLNIVIKNWKVRDSDVPGLPGDCGTAARPE